MSLRPWVHVAEEALVDFKVFHVHVKRRRSPRNDREVGFFLVRTPDWVNVVPVTTDERLVLVRQYRHGTEEFSLEIPGGLIDPGDADARQAAARELREETGYEATGLTRLGTMTPNPALFTNSCHTWLATGCRRVGELRQDPGEDLEVVTVPLDRVPDLVRRGEIRHALVLAALYFHRIAETG